MVSEGMILLLELSNFHAMWLVLDVGEQIMRVINLTSGNVLNFNTTDIEWSIKGNIIKILA